jgi:SagB-type dehydrogenase family enzyme
MQRGTKEWTSVNVRSKPGPAPAAPAGDALDVVLRYHQQTKHHFARYARGPGALDWANQPDPFRRYEGASLFSLPRLAPVDEPASPPYDSLYRAAAIANAQVTQRSLSRLLEYALAISAWKQAGDTRWALRSNPSSGNLHPTEAYVFTAGVAGLAPGLYHYTALEHALEQRAQWPPLRAKQLLQALAPDAFLIGLSSVIWREAWKYGERAFRYCQHDVGHAIGSLRIAARTLGWRMLLLDGVADDTIATLLGLDRDDDFLRAEREHPDCIVAIWPADRADARSTGTAVHVPASLPEDAVRDAAGLVWCGRANRLSRDAPVHWELLDQVARASWKTSTEHTVVELQTERSDESPAVDATRLDGPAPSAGQIIRQRRSALAFDSVGSISAERFFTLLARVMPGAQQCLSERAMPWDAVPWQPAVHLALFVHRVDGFDPGLYLLARDRAAVARLKGAMHPHFEWVAPAGCPADLPLWLLQQGDARALAAQLSCGQAIAGDSAFSLGMIAEFEPTLREHGPWFYRRLFWETGVIGQVLYLEAEAAGLRATGIGCYFDDPMHQVMGFNDARFQSLYHFTIGAAVEDTRLTTLPPYHALA